MNKNDSVVLTRRVIQLLAESFPNELQSVYIAGSIRRNAFVPNRSDVDYYAVISEDSRFDEGRKVVRRGTRLLSDEWRKKGVVSVDITVVTQSSLTMSTGLRTALIIGFDADLVWGDPQDLVWLRELNMRQVAVSLNERAAKRLASIARRYTKNALDAKDARRVKKIGLRCAYGVAMLRGAPYDPDYNHYKKATSILVPELCEPVEVLENSSDIAELFQATTRIVEFAHFHGIHMLGKHQVSDMGDEALK